MLSPARSPLHCPLARHVRLASNAVSTVRRGRNLTERYRRLENTARATQGSASAAGLQSDGPVPALTPTTPDTIAGFVIPKEPRAPADDECCMSGCAICVYDLYEEELAAYKESVVTLRAALSALHIPDTQWPAHIRTTHTSPMATATTTEKSKGAVLDAFEEMERTLKEKRDKRAAVEAESSS